MLCYRHKCWGTDTSAVLQTQVLYHRHVYNVTDTSDVLRHYSGCSSRSKGLICTCDGGAVSLCLGLRQPLPKDHLALSMLNIDVCNSPFPLYHPPLYHLSLHSANLWTIFECFIVFRLRRVHDIFARFVWLVHYLVHHYYNALVPRPDTSNVRVLLKTLVFSCILWSRKSSVDCQESWLKTRQCKLQLDWFILLISSNSEVSGIFSECSVILNQSVLSS